jgi:hypothetical protein
MRGVAGVDVGAAHVRRFSEDELGGDGWQLALSPHLDLEVVLGDHAVLRFSLKGSLEHPLLPLATVGIAVQF